MKYPISLSIVLFATYCFILFNFSSSSSSSSSDDDTHFFSSILPKNKNLNRRQHKRELNFGDENGGTTDSGVNSSVISYLHNLPRRTFRTFEQVTNEFSPTSVQYWEGVAFIGSFIAFFGIICCIPCSCCYFISYQCKCCGFRGRCNSNCFALTLKILVFVILLVLTGFFVLGITANIEVDDRYKSALLYPQHLLSNVNQKFNDLIEEANTVEIEVPEEILNFHDKVSTAAIKIYDSRVYSLVEEFLADLENIRKYLMYMIFIMPMIGCSIIGICGIFRFRDYFSSTQFLSVLCGAFFWIFMLAIVGGPLLMTDEFMADICINIDNIVTDQVDADDNVLDFFLFCANSSEASNFLNEMIDETEDLLDELGTLLNETETDDPNYEQLETRYNQTETLLEMEMNLTLCNQTSGAYSKMVDNLCLKFLYWNFLLCVACFGFIIFLSILVVVGSMITCCEREDLRQGYIEIDEVDDPPTVGYINVGAQDQQTTSPPPPSFEPPPSYVYGNEAPTPYNSQVGPPPASNQFSDPIPPAYPPPPSFQQNLPPQKPPPSYQQDALTPSYQQDVLTPSYQHGLSPSYQQDPLPSYYQQDPPPPSFQPTTTTYPEASAPEISTLSTLSEDDAKQPPRQPMEVVRDFFITPKREEETEMQGLVAPSAPPSKTGDFV